MELSDVKGAEYFQWFHGTYRLVSTTGNKLTAYNWKRKEPRIVQVEVDDSMSTKEQMNKLRKAIEKAAPHYRVRHKERAKKADPEGQLGLF